MIRFSLKRLAEAGVAVTVQAIHFPRPAMPVVLAVREAESMAAAPVPEAPWCTTIPSRALITVVLAGRRLREPKESSKQLLAEAAARL